MEKSQGRISLKVLQNRKKKKNVTFQVCFINILKNNNFSRKLFHSLREKKKKNKEQKRNVKKISLNWKKKKIKKKNIKKKELQKNGGSIRVYGWIGFTDNIWFFSPVLYTKSVRVCGISPPQKKKATARSAKFPFLWKRFN